LALDINPKFVNFTPAKDPDEFLNEFGRLELQKRIENAPSFIDYLSKLEIPESIPESTEKKLAILKNVFSILKPLGSNLMANEKVIQTAKSLGLKSSTEDILSEYKSYISKNEAQTHKVYPKKSKPSNNQSTDIQQEAPPEYMDAPPINDENFYPVENDSTQIDTNDVSNPEKLLLETLLTHPECILTDQITEILDKIQHFEVKRIVQWLKKIYLEIDEAEYSLFVQEKMKEAIPEQIKNIIASSLFNHSNLKLDEEIIEKTLKDLINRLDVGLLITERNALREKQLLADSDEDGLTILKDIQQIELKLLALRNK
jgi:DNA primase